MALQGDQGSVLFRWTKRGAIMWCLPMGPKSRAQGLESSWGMLSTCPGDERDPQSTLRASSALCPPHPAPGHPRWPSAPPSPYSLKIFSTLGFPLPGSFLRVLRNIGVPLFSASACVKFTVTSIIHSHCLHGQYSQSSGPLAQIQHHNFLRALVSCIGIFLVTSDDDPGHHCNVLVLCSGWRKHSMYWHMIILSE